MALVHLICLFPYLAAAIHLSKQQVNRSAVGVFKRSEKGFNSYKEVLQSGKLEMSWCPDITKNTVFGVEAAKGTVLFHGTKEEYGGVPEKDIFSYFAAGYGRTNWLAFHVPMWHQSNVVRKKAFKVEETPVSPFFLKKLATIKELQLLVFQEHRDIYGLMKQYNRMKNKKDPVIPHPFESFLCHFCLLPGGVDGYVLLHDKKDRMPEIVICKDYDQDMERKLQLVETIVGQFSNDKPRVCDCEYGRFGEDEATDCSECNFADLTLTVGRGVYKMNMPLVGPPGQFSISSGDPDDVNDPFVTGV